MEFILSQFLWLLPISFLPILINYINNRKYKTLNFSSTFLMDFVKTKSMKRLSVLNILILLIRVLIILFLVLTLSRPIIKSSINISNDASSQTVVIVVDDSFSNTMSYSSKYRIDNIKKTIEKIVSSYDTKTNLELLTSSKSLIYKGNVGNFNTQKIKLKNTFHSGNLGRLTEHYFHEDYIDNYVSHNMFIITDLDESFFSNFDLNESDWDIVVIDSSEEDTFPMIADVFVKEEVILPFEPFKVSVEVYNPSNIKYDNLRININVDNVIQNSDIFSIEALSTKTIIFNSLIDKIGNFEIVAEINYSSELKGFKFYLLQHSIPELNICFLETDSATKAYVKAAVNSFEAGKAISLSDCNFYYDEIINFDVVITNRQDLINSDNFNLYNKNGGHLVFLPKPVQSSSVNIPMHKKSIIKKTNISSKRVYKNIFENMNEDTLFSSTNKYLLPINQNSIIVNEIGSFWNRVQNKNGLIDFLAIPFDLNESDFVIKAFFVPFIHYLIFTNENQFSENIYLDNKLEYFLESFKKSDKKDISIVSSLTEKEIPINYFNSDLITVPGNYYFVSNDDTIKQASINISKNEIKIKKTNFQNIQTNNSKLTIIKMDSDFIDEFDSRIVVRELWLLMLFFAIMFLMIETILINVFRTK